MGTLYIVSTPIGNLEDITIRAVKTLLSVDYIACEDTRKTGFLLQELQKKFTTILYSNVVKAVDKPQLISYYDEIEFSRAPEIINLLMEDKNVALVSDSGTPLISDPGFKLVKECTRQNIKIVPIPGPSSIITALTISGLPTNQFCFLGYPPDKQNQRIKLFSELLSCCRTSKEINPTYIFFCSPHKIQPTLTDLEEVLGDIEIVIGRELTKIHEEIWRGKITDAADRAYKFKGELVLLFNTPPK